MTKKPFAKPWVILGALMAVLFVLLNIPSLRMSRAFPFIFGILFALAFVAAMWHVVWSIGKAVRGVRNIGTPVQGTYFGIPKWKLYLGATIIFIPVYFIVDYVSVRYLIVYKQGIADLRAAPVARQVFGDNWKPGWMAESSGEFHPEDGHAEIEVPISGDHGRGTLYGKGVKSHGQWTITELYVVPAGSSQHIGIPH